MSKKDRHPFKEGAHVAPFGLTLPHASNRLQNLKEDLKEKDPEHIMMKLWDNENTRDISLNFGKVPIDNILHRCNEECGKGVSFAGTPAHHHLPPKEDEVKIINTTIQWLATNCGRTFLSKFLRELKKLSKEKV